MHKATIYKNRLNAHPRVANIESNLTSPNEDIGNIFAVIVTYADRGRYVENLCETLFSLHIKKIVIIDNHSSETSKQTLQMLAQKFPDRLCLDSLPANQGTAHAFKKGMHIAERDPKCEFIWILDDDNYPDTNALDELVKLWSETRHKNKTELLMLASYRITKPVYKRAVYSHNPDIIIGERNYFRAFHVARLADCISQKGKARHTGNGSVPESGEISAAPYGGMFFHKDLLSAIGYPNERFYIYCDDHDFSHRLILRGGKIILSLKSILHDAEESWNAKGLGIFNIAKHPSRRLLYYSIRNRVHLELKITVNNYLTYMINAFIYAAAVFIVSLFRLNIGNFVAFWRGMMDGLKGKMGINEHYVL